MKKENEKTFITSDEIWQGISPRKKISVYKMISHKHCHYYDNDKILKINGKFFLLCGSYTKKQLERSFIRKNDGYYISGEVLKGGYVSGKTIYNKYGNAICWR